MGESTKNRANILKEAWMQVLHHQIEPQEQSNFLEHGGNSFKAAFLVSKLRQKCRIDLNIADVLRNPVYCKLRTVVQQAQTINNHIPQTSAFRQNSFPLSSSQQHMVDLQQTNPRSTAYVETIACYSSKPVEPTEVIKSLTERHPILTSKIQISDDNKMYKMIVTGETSLEVKSEILHENEKPTEYLTESTPVIDVILSPLYKFRHLITSANESFIALHVHRVLADDVTLRVLAEDLQAILSGKLKESHVQSCYYPENMNEERIYYTSEQHEVDKTFWKETFSSLPSESTLAVQPKSDNDQTVTAVYKARERVWYLPKETVKEIAKYCKMLEVTEFQYFLACSSLVLQRYLGVDEFCIAVPVTSRSDLRAHVDGFFINTVLFRVKVNKNQTLPEYVKYVSDEWLKILCHSRYSLYHVLKSEWNEGGISLNAFCNVMINFTTQYQPEDILRIGSKHANMPFKVNIIYGEKSKTCQLIFEWAEGLIDGGIAERLSDTVVRLSSKCFETKGKLFELEILSPLELQLLQSFNTEFDDAEICRLGPVYKEFQEHVARDSTATAIYIDGNQTSYGCLNSLSSRIAYVLCEHLSQQVLKRKPVVIVMKRDQYAIASIFGIWKAGGHFLPVALSNETCLKDIFERDTPAAMLYNVATSTVKSMSASCPTWSIDDLLFSHDEQVTKEENLMHSKGDDIAYITRTSGSTGKPKQCRISHKSLRIYVEAYKQKHSLSKYVNDVLQWFPLSFDGFISDILVAFVCGQGKLIICPDSKRLDITYILRLTRDQHATLFDMTPQFALEVINNSHASDLESIKFLMIGGDAFHQHAYMQIKSQLRPDQRVINCYGMTEATIDSATFECNVMPVTRSGTVPIGKPLPGVTLHILDSKTLQPCPVGTIGELYISGNTLATGDVELVQMNHYQGKALKTGDAASWLPTGDIELFGRLDNMVKVRGFRISTTEIENTIVDLVHGIKEAHVIPIKDNDNDAVEFLCAYLVLDDSFQHKTTITQKHVCSKLKSAIPYYMLPDKIQIIQRVPLTSHGKIDKGALSKISHTKEIPNEQQSDANSSTTVKLREWFAEAIGLPHDLVSNDVTFTEQGGNSLILLRFWSLISNHSTFNVEIADLFSYPTICSLAQFIEHREDIAADIYDKSPESPVKDMKISSCNDTDVAITGIGMRLPGGVMSLAELWDVLQKGHDLIGTFPEQRKTDVLNCLPLAESNRLMKSVSFEGAFLSDIDSFDHGFFGIAPEEAKCMAPEQRLFLQVATEALAEGHSLSRVKGSKVGVFVGTCEVGYAKLNHPDSESHASGVMPGMIAKRVAYQWDLKGPTMLIDTACCSSLTALELACESIRRKGCDGALVGGMHMVLYPSQTDVFGQGNILSPDFRCKAFDNDANGTAVGEGVLCLYVEPLNVALKKGKPVYAVVKGVASNGVGRGNGITAPSSSSHMKVIQEALESANLDPSDITFVEGCGTGANLGDKIELSALSSVFCQRPKAEPLPIGAVTSIFGHMDTASGLLGVFKVLACMVSKSISPIANFKSPHPELINSSLSFPTACVKWECNNGIRAAGISSSGETGTNCHVILFEDPSSVIHDKEHSPLTTSTPLIFIGGSLQHLTKQAALYKTYIEQMVEQLCTGTIQGLCLTVAERLIEYQSIRNNKNGWRMVIDAKSTIQMLKLLDMITSSEDTDVIRQLSSTRSDIHLKSSHQNLEVEATPEVQQFLEDGLIDIGRLFNGKHTTIRPVLGVTVAFYQESRHWLETSAQNVRNLCEVGVLDLIQEKISNVRELVRSLPLYPTKDLEDTQRKFCTAIIISLLHNTSLSNIVQGSEEVSFDEAFVSTRILEKYRKFFFVMIRELWENNVLQAVGSDKSKCCLDRIKFKSEDLQDADADTIAKSAISKYPAWADCFRFPLYCSKYLHQVLRGEISPLSVMYPQGDLTFLDQFDQLGDLLGDVYYNMYIQLIAECALQLSREGKRVRILEVGAGVGRVTRQLVLKVKGSTNVEYWFTDPRKESVQHAKTVFADYLHMMKFSTFDISKSPSEQRLFGSFDIVISFNAIHTTKSVRDSVLNLKSCVCEDGTLFIIESVRNDMWATLAWGILDRWWYFDDYDLRPADPKMKPEKWEEVLCASGFDSVFSFPQHEKERRYVEKFLFLCSQAPSRQMSNKTKSMSGWWETDTNRFDAIKEYDEEENVEAQN